MDTYEGRKMYEARYTAQLDAFAANIYPPEQRHGLSFRASTIAEDYQGIDRWAVSNTEAGHDVSALAYRTRRLESYGKLELTIRGLPTTPNSELSRLMRGDHAPYYVVAWTVADAIRDWMVVDMETVRHHALWNFGDRVERPCCTFTSLPTPVLYACGAMVATSDGAKDAALRMDENDEAAFDNWIWSLP